MNKTNSNKNKRNTRIQEIKLLLQELINKQKRGLYWFHTYIYIVLTIEQKEKKIQEYKK